MKSDVCKPYSDQPWQDELWYLIQRFFEQCAFVNNHLLCFSPTIHNSTRTSRPWRSVLNFKLSVLTFLMSNPWSMSLEQKLCQVKIFQIQPISNAIWCIDQKFAFKNSCISCLALIFNLNIPRMTILYAGIAGCKIQHTDMNLWLSGSGESQRVGRVGFD